ncbi:MAG: uracil phosphoribosyltransferase [Saprospiraceae bacterium]|nr:uracil phosphoribosyltransferase [Saprospiraceae bacterium]
MTHNLSDKASLANQFIAELRDVHIQKDRLRFRRNLERIGEVLAYEISKTLKYEQRSVETPLGTATVALPRQQVVLACILRAGIPLHEGMSHFFDQAGHAFVSAYRRHHKDGSFEISVQYVSCPDLSDSVLIVIDPMLASGASMVLAAQELQQFGTPAKIHFVTAIASTAGVEYVKRLFPKADIWAGAIDEELTAKSYIVPGLGDAGDLAFGEKLQE